jgi:hypothetical protein
VSYFRALVDRHYAYVQRENAKLDEAEKARISTETAVAQYIANLADNAGFKEMIDADYQRADGEIRGC